jgi:hypothetical protein
MILSQNINPTVSLEYYPKTLPHSVSRILPENITLVSLEYYPKTLTPQCPYNIIPKHYPTVSRILSQNITPVSLEYYPKILPHSVSRI